jgi:hypothetical protein
VGGARAAAGVDPAGAADACNTQLPQCGPPPRGPRHHGGRQLPSCDRAALMPGSGNPLPLRLRPFSRCRWAPATLARPLPRLKPRRWPARRRPRRRLTRADARGGVAARRAGRLLDVVGAGAGREGRPRCGQPSSPLQRVARRRARPPAAQPRPPPPARGPRNSPAPAPPAKRVRLVAALTLRSGRGRGARQNGGPGHRSLLQRAAGRPCCHTGPPAREGARRPTKSCSVECNSSMTRAQPARALVLARVTLRRPAISRPVLVGPPAAPEAAPSAATASSGPQGAARTRQLCPPRPTPRSLCHSRRNRYPCPSCPSWRCSCAVPG